MILATGTDRYDPERVGPTDAGYARYGVELHVGDEKPPYSACCFKDPDRRRDALLGLIKVLS